MTKNMKPWVWVVAFCGCGMFLTGLYERQLSVGHGDALIAATWN